MKEMTDASEMTETSDTTEEVCDTEYKLSATLPCDLAMEFTAKARKQALGNNEPVKGAIGRAAKAAIEHWLGEEEEGEEEEEE